MHQPDLMAQSFVIKVWVEEIVSESGTVVWRGRIRHVPSGRQHYFEQLHEVVTFMAPYLQAMGARLDEYPPNQPGGAIG